MYTAKGLDIVPLTEYFLEAVAVRLEAIASRYFCYTELEPLDVSKALLRVPRVARVAPGHAVLVAWSAAGTTMLLLGGAATLQIGQWASGSWKAC